MQIEPALTGSNRSNRLEMRVKIRTKLRNLHWIFGQIDHYCGKYQFFDSSTKVYIYTRSRVTRALALQALSRYKRSRATLALSLHALSRYTRFRALALHVLSRYTRSRATRALALHALSRYTRSCATRSVTPDPKVYRAFRIS